MFANEYTYLSKEGFDEWANNTRIILRTLGMTQQDLADVLGITRVTVTERLNNKKKLISRLQFWAYIYGLRKLVPRSSRPMAIQEAMHILIDELESRIS